MKKENKLSQGENDIDKANLELKKLEIQIRQKELQKIPQSGLKLTIERATIIVAIIAFAGSFTGSFLEGCNAQRQQRREFESTLITNAIQTGNSDASRKNLKFLLDVGLVSNEKWKITLNEIIADSMYKLPSRWSNSDSVYICLNAQAYAFHGNQMCRGLSTCNDSILVVSPSAAMVKYHRKPCGYCY